MHRYVFKVCKNANMTQQFFLSQINRYGYKKTMNFMLISKTLKWFFL
jgi:hypothetical protein